MIQVTDIAVMKPLLAEKFGFTAENVCDVAKTLLNA